MLNKISDKVTHLTETTSCMEKLSNNECLFTEANKNAACCKC